MEIETYAQGYGYTWGEEEDGDTERCQFTRFIGHPSLPPFIGGKRLERGGRPENPFYNGYGVVYLPGDIKGLTDKLHLLSPEFFAGNTKVRNELVHVLDALLRLKQLTCREYTDINNSLVST